MKSLTLWTLAMALLVSASGCGNIGPNSGNIQKTSADTSSGSPMQLSGAAQAPSNYSCPAQPNVNPDYNWTGDGTGNFTVCRSKDSSYSILVFGSVSTSTNICVFPVQNVTTSRVVYKMDLNGLPMKQCADTAQNGIFMTFNLTNFDGVFIVAEQDKDAMISCFTTPGSACPRYAQGKI